jgi:hypothetical protein
MSNPALDAAFSTVLLANALNMSVPVTTSPVTQSMPVMTAIQSIQSMPPVPVIPRTAPQRRLLIRFDNPDMFDDVEPFEISKSIYPIEYQKPRQRIPIVKSDKKAREEMMYYVQYVLEQFRQASNLFSSFHVNGDDITVVFDCPNGFSIAYDVRLYCAGDWMLSDANISRSYHFSTWGAIDFAVLDMLKTAREIIVSTFKQPLNSCEWPDQKGVLAFVDPPKKSHRRESDSHSSSDESDQVPRRRHKHSSSDESESESSESESSDSEQDRRKGKKKPSKSSKKRK